MKNKTINLPIFPLPVFLLPEGVTRLRIFEPRYLKMIRVATQDQGFVILSNYKEAQLIENIWGSWVEIINFDQGKDGILEVDVKCKSLVNIIHAIKDHDSLYFGDTSYLEHWPKKKKVPSIDELSTSLQGVFENNELLNQLYPIKHINNAYWVVARWLELLPVNETFKSIFIEKNSFKQAKDFIQNIIYK
jgi:Lon protease-like protein